MKNETLSTVEYEELSRLTDEVNSSGLAASDELKMLTEAFPDVLNLDPEGQLVVISQNEEIAPQNPVFEHNTDLPQPSITPSSKHSEADFMSPNRSLDGRMIDILPREQRLLAGIRRGLPVTELETLYSNLPLERRRQQLERDAQHIQELLLLHGYTVNRNVIDGKLYLIEEKREFKPRSVQSSTTRPLTTPPSANLGNRLDRPTLPNQNPEPKPERKKEELSEDVLISEVFDGTTHSEPLKLRTVMNRVNFARGKRGLPPIDMTDAQLWIRSLMESGHSIESITTKNRTIYYKK